MSKYFLNKIFIVNNLQTMIHKEDIFLNQPPFLLFYLASFLESMAIFYFIYNFNRITFISKEFFIISSIYPLLAYVIRKLPISFGIHSIILILLISVFLNYYFKINLHYSLLSATLVVAILILSEYITVIFFMKLINFNFTELINNNITWFISCMPHIFIIILLAYLIGKHRS